MGCKGKYIFNTCKIIFNRSFSGFSMTVLQGAFSGKWRGEAA
jgi:hypothetical protein